MYMSSLPPHAHHHLDKLLDYDNDGVDKDLNEIADTLLNWEEKVAVDLCLTAIDIHDIKKDINGQVLQR